MVLTHGFLTRGNFPRKNFGMSEKFHAGGKFSGDTMTGYRSDSVIHWDSEPVTVKLYFSATLLCSVISSQCLQQTVACL